MKYRISNLLVVLLLSYNFTFNFFAKNIKVAVLKFGSVNWELDVINYHELDKKNDITIQKLVMTNKDAATIAFLSKTVDIFITDWIWVNKQRNNGNLVYFSPYSNAAGSLMVSATSEIKEFVDLKNKRVGVAGGSLDKSWLFLRAYGIKKYGYDPLKFFNTSFAAPPLINGLLRNNELDAGFNYWNYAARLKAQGFRNLVSVDTILPDIGIEGELPLIGYVFRENFEKANRKVIKDFIKTSNQARQILLESDKEWDRIFKLTGANDKLMLKNIRDNFRGGIPSKNHKKMLKNMQNAFQILSNIGGKELVGNSKDLSVSMYWNK